MKHIHNRLFFATDILLLPLAAYFSFALRIDSWSLGTYWHGYILFTGIALLATVLIFQIAGIYARYWEYASAEEVLLLSTSILIATATTVAIAMIGEWIMTIPAHPHIVALIFLPWALVAVAAPRMAVRVVSHYSNLHNQHARLSIWAVVVVGAGDTGAAIVRELQSNRQLGMDVIGFLDDDPRKQGMRIHGVPVLGRRADIPDIVRRNNIHRVIIALPSASGKIIREISSICEQAGVITKIIPSMSRLLDGTMNISQLRNIQIEDLLRRAPIQTDIAAVRELIRGKRVLITGGGGSIGSELCRQVLHCEPGELIVLGHGENSVFDIQNDLNRQVAAGNQATQVTAVIADIRFAERIHLLFDAYHPDIVFHAAAHKHVPLMELNPAEAITNNVLGTRNLLDAAVATNVKHFIMISSDKAVNPTSVMGASKRAAELLVHAAAVRSGYSYAVVRFGNVLGSRGSVVHTFKQQIARGGPVTITDPDMKRFFITIPEAVQLVLQAAVLAHGGEVLVLDMGQPVKIVDLASDMIRLSGLEVGRDIDIVFSGLRPGEKLFEELFIPGEEHRRTQHHKIFISNNASSLIPESLDLHIQALARAAEQNDRSMIIHQLRCLVPEFQPPQELRPATDSPTRESLGLDQLPLCEQRTAHMST